MDHSTVSPDFSPTTPEVRRAFSPAAVILVLAAFQAWLLGRLRRHAKDALIEAPTGSGKTLLVRTLAALDLGRRSGFSHVLVAAPQEQIERGFVGGADMTVRWPEATAAQPDVHVPAGLFRAARGDGCGTRVSIRRYLAAREGRRHALVCTHAALAKLEAGDLPDDLTGYALIIDEAHHLPADGLSRVARLWSERGGRLILLTATPYRADGLPVVLPGMVVIRRSMAEHMEEGYAPRTLASEIVALGRPTQRVSPAQLTGEVAPPASYTRITAAAVVQRWKEDGRPKTIVRVPPGRGRLVKRLIASFQRVGARVLDATGVERRRKQRFLTALDAERARCVASSEINVIVGICRVLEGTDWPHCAAVYSIGTPRALQVVVQLAGRALRKKPADYPEQYRDLARLTFFVPCARGEAIAELSLEHSRHVLLTCAFMADHAAGQAWVVSGAVRRAIRRALEDRPVTEVEEALDAAAMAEDPVVRAEAQLALAVARDELMSEGESPTVAAVLVRAVEARPDLPLDVIEQVATEALAGTPGEIGGKAARAVDGQVARRLRIDPQVQAAMKEAFAQVLVQFRDATLAHAPALDTLGRQMHVLTGGKMREFARRLADACPRPLTESDILAWADAHHAASGRWPTAESGPVGAAPGETWAAVDSALREGHRGLWAGGSLARLLQQHRGVANRLDARQLTTALLEGWIEHHRVTTGAWPKRDSGPIAGTDLTWSAIDQALHDGRHGLPRGTSLARYLQDRRGVRNIRSLPALTDEVVAAWATAFQREHGRWPTRDDGPIRGASRGETWSKVGAAIEQGLRTLKRRTSLAAFCAEVCGAPAPGTVRRALSVEQIVADARAYHERTGSWPTPASDDPALSARNDSWNKIDRALRDGGRGLPRTTLVKLLAEHAGARNRNRPGPLTEAMIRTWVQAHWRRTGEDPTRISGPVHGVPGESWGAIDGALKHGCRGLRKGSSLRKFIDRLHRRDS